MTNDEREQAVRLAKDTLGIFRCMPPAPPAQTLLARAVLDMHRELRPSLLSKLGALLVGRV